MGFDIELFVHQPVDQNLVCSICHCVQEKPMAVCENGHTFCSSCIQVWEQHSDECPGCRSIISNKLLSLPLQNMIMSLKVHCPNKPKQAKNEAKRSRVEGTKDVSACKKEDIATCCDWEGTLSDYLEKHCNQECRFRVVACPLGCSRKMRAYQLEEHKEKCDYRTVTCTCCQKEVKWHSLRAHQTDDCPKTMEACGFCGEKVLREDLGKRPSERCVDDPPGGQSSEEAKYTGHYKVCPKLIVRCEFYNQGCTDFIKREDLDEHHAKYARTHAKLIADNFNRIREDHRWYSITTVEWWIPEIIVRRAARDAQTGSATFIQESGCTKVGNYQAFLRLAVNDGAVCVSACVYRPTSRPYLDSLKFKCAGGVMTMSEKQMMQRDNGRIHTWSVGGALRYIDDDNNERTVTLDDLVRSTYNGSCMVSASFRFKRPKTIYLQGMSHLWGASGTTGSDSSD